MEAINVNETINEVVENITTGNDSAKLLKIAAGVGGTALVGLGVYEGCKLLNQKVIKPMVAKMKEKKESKTEVKDNQQNV